MESFVELTTVIKVKYGHRNAPETCSGDFQSIGKSHKYAIVSYKLIGPNIPLLGGIEQELST